MDWKLDPTGPEATPPSLSGQWGAVKLAANATVVYFRRRKKLKPMSLRARYFTSSSIIKEAAQFGGDIKGMVPPIVNEKLKKKFKRTR